MKNSYKISESVNVQLIDKKTRVVDEKIYKGEITRVESMPSLHRGELIYRYDIFIPELKKFQFNTYHDSLKKINN